MVILTVYGHDMDFMHDKLVDAGPLQVMSQIVSGSSPYRSIILTGQF
jgi:hypothetical protein